MQNWDDLRYFLSVARSGSFSAAAESLSVNGSTVGRRVEHLEQTLGFKLFDRQRHGMDLSADGRRLLDYVQQMENAALAVNDVAQRGEGDLSGTLTLSAPELLASAWVIPHLDSFQKSYPAISLQLRCDDRTHEGAAGNADLTISLKAPPLPQSTADMVGELKFQVFAAARYINQFGKPKDWADLGGHKMVDYMGYAEIKALSLWQETLKAHDQVMFRSDSLSSCLRAVGAGMGIGIFPQFYHHTVTGLIPVELPCELFDMPIYLGGKDQTRDKPWVEVARNHLLNAFNRDRRTWFS